MMETAETYRGYEIVETGWTTEVRVGFDRTEARPVYVIPGMKERPSSPFLTTVQEARDYIDEELAGREAMREARTATFEASVKVRGAASLGVTVPASVSRSLGLDVGDRVRVTVEKLRGAAPRAGRRAPARSCADAPHCAPGRTEPRSRRTGQKGDAWARLISSQGRMGKLDRAVMPPRGVEGMEGGTLISSQREPRAVCVRCVCDPREEAERKIGGREDCSERSPLCLRKAILWRAKQDIISSNHT